MTTLQTLITVNEYLSTSYHPDVNYSDGQIEERNVGEKEHGKLQFWVAFLLKRTRKLAAFIETRLRVSATRYRVPDICAYVKEPDESVFTQPPELCIEILSPEDRLSRTIQIVEEYLAMGVPSVWVLDPLQKKAYAAYAAGGFHEVTGQIATADNQVVLMLDELFSEEDLF